MNTISIIILCIILMLILYVYFSNRYELFDDYEYTPDELFQHLSFVDNLLTENKIKHWIMFGTLLGGVRGHDIISYDYDFDLGGYVEDANNILELNNKIKDTGYRFYLPESTGIDFDTLSISKDIWRVSIKIEYNGIIMGDIYLFHKFDDGYMRRYDPTNKIYFTPNITYPSWFTDELENVLIRDKLFNAPRDAKILLEHWYGKTWNIPIKAMAQGGKSNPNSDYYGMSKDVNLNFLTEYVTNKNVFIKPNVNEKIIYIYPSEQKEWVINNENII